MSESFVEKRKRELGLTAADQPITNDEALQPQKMSFVEQRKMELGLIPDTRPKVTQDFVGPPTPPPNFTLDLNNSPIVQGSQQSRQPNENQMRANSARVRQIAEHQQWQSDHGRDVPVIGPVLKGLDAFSHNPVVDTVADVARSFYVPGGGVGNVAGLYGAAESALGKFAPKLVGTLGGKLATEAAVGAPLGAGQAAATGADSWEDLGKGAAFGAAGGAALPLLGAGVRRLGQFAGDTAADLTKNVIRNVADNTRTPVKSPFSEGLPPSNPIAQGYTENVAKSLEPKFRMTETAPALQTGETSIPTNSLIKTVGVPAQASTVANELAAAQSGGTFVRGNYKNLSENGNFSDEFNQGLKSQDQTYERITNAETVAKANDNVKNLTAAEAKFHGNEVITPEHIATGYRLIQELDRGGHTERALNVANKLAADLTRGGQSQQAAGVLQRLSPEGRLLDLTRQAEKNGKVVTAADGQAYMALAREAQSTGLSGQRSAEVMDIFDRAKKGQDITAEDNLKLNELVQDMNSFISAREGKPPKEAKLSPKMQEKAIRDRVLSTLQEQETQVLERMKARRNRISSTPFDVYADYALLGSIKLAKGAISFSKWAEQMIKDVGSEIKPHLVPIYEKSQRLLESTANKITDVKVSNAEKVVEKFIKEGNIAPQDEKMLRELVKQVDDLANNRGIKADMKMQQILNGYQKSNMGAKVATLRYMAMLLNTSTQAVNAISGPMMMTYHHMLDIMATPLDLIYSGITKSPRSTTFKQGPGAFDNLFTPVMDWFKGLKVGSKAGWQGVDPEGIATQHDIRGLAFKSKLNPFGLAERTLGAVAKAPDYATYNASRKIEMRKLAYLDAINKGIKGKANIRNYMDKFLANPDPKALEQAARIGKKLTFQNTEGLAGKAASAARNVNALTGSKDLGIANAIVPFVRTPTNIAITGIENTPAGVLKSLFEINRLRQGADDISKREILKTFVSATLGGTVTLGGLGYILSDLGVITGDYSSSDKDVQALQDSIGKGKFRFNTSAFGRMFDALTSGDVERLKEVSQYRAGDKQIDYNKLQPLAFPVAAGATYQQGKGKPVGERLANAGKSSLSSLFGMSALQGLQQNFTTKPGSTGSEIPLQIVQNVGENFVKGFSPSALAQEARRQDPLQRNVSYNGSFVDDVKSYYQSRTPGLTKSLQPKQNNLGDLKQNAPGVLGQYANPLKSEIATYNKAAQVVNDLITRTGDEKLAPTAMEKSIRGTLKGQKLQTSVKLEPARYRQLQQDVGREIAKLIGELPQNLDDAAKAKKIEDIYTKVKDSARTKLKRELGFKLQ